MEAVPGPGQLTRGSAAAFHALEPNGSEREQWWLDVDRPALVLGSTQRESVADLDACASAGVEVVHRRSGGGAVLMLPGEVLWLDIVVPRDDPRWDDDIARSMWWLGDAWATALRGFGVEDVDVHRGPLVQTAWSRLVCFDGLGAGEVTVAGAKAVGISQRRTRGWARLQSAVHVQWRPDALLALLREPHPTIDELADVWTVPAGLDPAALRAAVTELLTD